MTKGPYFVVGGRYRNRKGWYKVLEVQDGAIHVVMLINVIAIKKVASAVFSMERG